MIYGKETIIGGVGGKYKMKLILLFHIYCIYTFLNFILKTQFWIQCVCIISYVSCYPTSYNVSQKKNNHMCREYTSDKPDETV